MDELAAQLLFVLSQFGLKSVIGLGVGAGANILARFAMQHPDKVSFAEEEKKLYSFIFMFLLNFRLVHSVWLIVAQRLPVG
jgi:pimeloyl-ACP methyl ester carboxylesterase